MPVFSNPPESKTGFRPFFWSYFLPGAGLLLLAFVTTALAAANDVLSLGGFLCFFTLGVTLIIEGIKKIRARKPPSIPAKHHEPR